jgi:hypothetical protein
VRNKLAVCPQPKRSMPWSTTMLSSARVCTCISTVVRSTLNNSGAWDTRQIVVMTPTNFSPAETTRRLAAWVAMIILTSNVKSSRQSRSLSSPVTSSSRTACGTQLDRRKTSEAASLLRARCASTTSLIIHRSPVVSFRCFLVASARFNFELRWWKLRW